MLEKAYRRAVRQATVQKAMNAALQALSVADVIPIPADLAERIRGTITGTAQSWDMAIWQQANSEEAKR